MFMKNYTTSHFKSFLYHWFLKYNYLYRKITCSFEPEMKHINTFTKSNDIALDIGANIGIYTRYLSKNFKKVESFEPIEKAYEYIEALHLPNLTLHKLALSNKAGRNTINVPIKGGTFRFGNSSIENFIYDKYENIHKLSINSELLDSYNYKKIDFIKIDVEGHELNVLKGGEKTIRKLKPTLLIEIEQRHLPANLSIYDVFHYINEMGYEGFFIDNNHIKKITNFELNKNQVQYLKNKNIKLTNRKKNELYINNFFFVAE